MKISYLAFSIGLLMACAAPAVSAPPAPTNEYKIVDEHTTKSPDGATTIERYYKTDKDENWIWQFWARRADTMTLLGPEQRDYSANFSFTSDSRWGIRLQKTGSGEHDLFGKPLHTFPDHALIQVLRFFRLATWVRLAGAA